MSMKIKSINSKDDTVVVNVNIGDEVLPIFYSDYRQWDSVKADNNISDVPNGLIADFPIDFEYEIKREGEEYNNKFGKGVYKHDKLSVISKIHIEVDVKAVAKFYANGFKLKTVKDKVEEVMKKKILDEIELFL